MLDPSSFGFRSALDAHSTLLKNSVINPETIFPVYQDLDSIIQAVFSEQPTNFDASQISMASLTENIIEHPIFCVSSLFYQNNFTIIPEIRRGNPSGATLHGDPEKNIQELGATLFVRHKGPFLSRRHNRTYFISGEIGVGKSAVLKKLMSSKEIRDWVYDKQGWFLRINVQDFVDTNPFTTLSIYKTIFDRLIQLINYFSERKEDVIAPDNFDVTLLRFRGEIEAALTARDGVRAESVLLDALEFSQKNIFRGQMIIIFDNADYIFYVTEQALQPASEDYTWRASEGEHNLIFSFIDFVSHISYHDSRWVHLGATIIYVVRSEGISLIRQALSKGDGGDKEIPDDLAHFVVTSPTSVQAQQILRDRIYLLFLCMHVLLVREVNDYFKDARGVEVLELPVSDGSGENIKLRFQGAILQALHEFEKERRSFGLVTEAERKIEVKIKRINSVFDDGSALIASLLEDAKEDNPRAARAARAVTQLLSVSSTGMRGALATFQTFAWLHNDYRRTTRTVPTRVPLPRDAEVVIQTDRVMTSPALPLLVHMLNGRVRFSERETKFPNVFLAHSREYHGTTVSRTYPNYWLVPCLIKYVHRYRRVPLMAVFHTFCMGEDTDAMRREGCFGGDGVYDNLAVRHLLWRLQSINSGPRIFRLSGEVDFSQRRISFIDLELTNRGQRLVEARKDQDRGPLAEDFRYLQLVIDDDDVALPSGSFETSKNPFHYHAAFGYDYLVKSSYNTTYNRVLRHKLLKLARFFGVLNAAKRAEEQRYWRAWARLQRIGVLDGWLFDIPNVLSEITQAAHGYSRNSLELPSDSEVQSEYETYSRAYDEKISSYYCGR